MSAEGHEAAGEDVKAADLLRGSLPDLPNAERRAAEVLLENYPAAGLNTVATVAKEAGVSAPTVLRLLTRLGFESYPAFQRTLLRELDQRSLSPLQQIDVHAPDADALTRSPAVFLRSVDETLRTTAQRDFLAAVSALSSPKLTVYATGGRFTSMLAKYLILQLEMLRPDTHYLSVDDRSSILADRSRSDVILAIDLRRYQNDTVWFGREAVKRGARLVLITDEWRSPLAEHADHVLTVSLDAPHPLDSLVPTMAILEALIAGIVDDLGDAPRERMRRYEEAWEFSRFSPANRPAAGRGAERPQPPL